MKKKTLAVLAVALASAGCSDADSVGLIEPQTSNTETTVQFGDALAPDTTSVEQGKALAQATFAVLRVLDESDTWTQAHSGMQSLIQNADPLQKWAIEQNAAVEMLRGYLLTGSPTEERAKAAAFYTELLVENQSPEMEIALRAIRMYESAWPTELRRSLATEASGVADATWSQRAECGEDCAPSDPRVKALVPEGDQPDVEMARMAQVARDLQAIAAE